VDEVVVYRPEHYSECDSVLTSGDRKLSSESNGHRAPNTALVCDCGGHENRRELPASVSVSQFGPQQMSLMVLLMGVYWLRALAGHHNNGLSRRVRDC